jgi:predicted TIM-barrel fold metal-dependent hydrolase
MSTDLFDVSTLFGVWPKRRADIALPTLLRSMREHHIARACTLSAAGIFYDFVEGNHETLAAAAAHPELTPAGTVNPCRWLGCLDEARRLIDQGVRLFRFFPQYQEWHINQAPFRKLLREVLARAGVVLILPADMGFTAIGDMAAAIPNPIIVESFKYAFLAEAIVVMQERPNVYVETHLINSPNWVELLKAEVGVERLIFGSNAPLAYVSAATAQIEYAPVPEADKALIFGGNLRRLLGLPVAA